MNYNKVILGGRLTATPVLKNLPSSNDVVCNFRIAVNRMWRDLKGSRHEDTCFIDVSAFGKRAELVTTYFHKGSNILIEGRLRYEVWENEKKETRSKHSVVVDNIQFVDPKSKSMDQDSADATSSAPPREMMPRSETMLTTSPRPNPPPSVPTGDLDGIDRNLAAPESIFDSPPVTAGMSEPGSVVAAHLYRNQNQNQLVGAGAS